MHLALRPTAPFETGSYPWRLVDRNSAGQYPRQTLILTEMVGCDRPQRLPATAPCNVCIYKVTDKAGDCWSTFEGCIKASLYQVQMAHDARPSILFNLRDSFGDFLKEASAEKEGYPSSLEVLLNDGGIKLVLTDKDDPENSGFVQWDT